ncbi:hypothetical protein AKJ09_01503 [Labilithrix luteola]|uniref:Uncharacterized protein n=1 Tax=Labilithrix luteola TaxID=1391654 RepID=A0A0K1PNZ7_9BACT|nr:hypothetical protein [Labilithrix luteola]AKU94839.1 hypothetical protein AKJ09_01503 [Labilithrix luteola]
MKSRSREFLDRVVPAACVDLFGAYGITIRPKSAPAVGGSSRPPFAPDECSGGLVSFSGDLMSGSLLLVGSFEFLSSSRPPEVRRRPLTSSSSADWILVRDWSMELVNQLLGRIRNRLHVHRVALETKCPTAVSGPSLGVAMRSRTSTPFEFATSTPGQVVCVWLDATLSPSVELGATVDDTATLQKEGEVVVF